MTTREVDNTDENSEISPTHSANSTSTSNSTNRGINGSNNNSISNTNEWFRSIPRRFRKFISKHRHFSFSHSQNSSNYGNTTDALVNQSVLDGDSGVDGNFFSSTDQLVNDEEVAMIRACSQMTKYGWFWGAISKHQAQERLHAAPNGSFLVRNSRINLHNFTISFRTAGKTLHYRIEFVDGYWQTFNSKHKSIVDLIDDAMKKSKENVFCYVKQSSQLLPPFPVRLTNPISHFGDIHSLQSLCRSVIQKNVKMGEMDYLPLPNKLITFCKEWDTVYREMPIPIG